jgi:hypothetical protein
MCTCGEGKHGGIVSLTPSLSLFELFDQLTATRAGIRTLTI